MDYVEDGVDMENGNNQHSDGSLDNDNISPKKGSGKPAVKTFPYKKKKAPSGLVISSRGASATVKSSPKPVEPRSRSHSPATASHDSLTGPGVSNRCQQGHGTSTAQQANDLTTPPRTPSPPPLNQPSAYLTFVDVQPTKDFRWQIARIFPVMHTFWRELDLVSKFFGCIIHFHPSG
ncbi:hypothetical protein FRC08_018379 [Ceratobasidium sp. 394]|nr:hypothetical protein FRC08_018379 [Ceratobasidium sp. 394]